MKDTQSKKPTERFSDRVADYVRYRPPYPEALIALLQEEGALAPDAVVADAGSGTGLLARLFLERGHVVYGIEPNPEMRAAGERELGHFARFHSVAGKAEETTLPGKSVDLVTAGQAFHWFEPQPAKAEFRRILRPGGWAVLIWNDRPTSGSALVEGYEQLLRAYAADYPQVDHKRITGTEKELRRFLGRGFFSDTLPNPQSYDFQQLRGRLLSSSYAPQVGDPHYEPLLAGLRELFASQAQDDRVILPYVTRVYGGRLGR